MVAEDYVHRIGRTGRAGATGDAISLVCVDEQGLLREIEALLRHRIPSEVVEGFEPDRSIRPEPIRRQTGPGPGRALRGAAAARAARSPRGRSPRDPRPRRSARARDPRRLRLPMASDLRQSDRAPACKPTAEGVTLRGEVPRPSGSATARWTSDRVIGTDRTDPPRADRRTATSPRAGAPTAGRTPAGRIGGRATASPGPRTGPRPCRASACSGPTPAADARPAGILPRVDARILLVEDDPSIREITTIGLRNAGFEVDAAADGQAGLDRFRAEPYDLILLDVMLPRLDGLEVCRAIRRVSTVPVVMLTARADTIDVVVGLEAGADDYVKKPFEVPELVARVRAAIRRAGREVGDPDALRLGSVAIDLAGRTATKRRPRGRAHAHRVRPPRRARPATPAAS